VSACEFSNSPLIELYFYGEIDADDRARVDAHLGDCLECRQRLQDLQAIREALARRPPVDAPAAGDWSGFMRRLDAACGIARGREKAPLAPRPAPTLVSARPRRRWMPALAFAAMLVLVTMAVIVASRFRGASDGRTAQPAVTSTDATTRQPAAMPHGPESPDPSGLVTPGRNTSAAKSLVEQSEEHFERSKLVVLGLATRDPRATPASDWGYERQLAASLLSDTRMYRLAAQDRGLSDLARAMGDLETVLLQASLSDQQDPDALERLQRLIRKRDLVTKMQVVGSSGI
jgi:putative zinc finger protein